MSGDKPFSPFRLAARQLLAAAAFAVVGIWLWPGDATGWPATLAALSWIVGAVALIGACFWSMIGIVDGQWRRSGFRPGRWLTETRRRR